jgi:hypothetical protein
MLKTREADVNRHDTHLARPGRLRACFGSSHLEVARPNRLTFGRSNVVSELVASKTTTRKRGNRCV